MSLTSEDLVTLLRKHRAVLLACEAIGWLHMTGKAHPDFLRHQGGTGVSYTEKSWHESLNPAWSDRLAWLPPTANVLKWPSSLAEFVGQYAQGQSVENLVGCLQAGHAMASGIEKNVSKDTSKYLRQDATHLWLTTAFGHPIRNLLVDPPAVLEPGAWQTLLGRIGAILDQMQELARKSGADTESWWEWREDAIGERGWLRRAFETTLAETRLPNNDVTLWDQSYVAGALFKSAVAGLLLLQTPPEDAWSKLKSETRWRVLTIGFGTEHYEARAVRIGDWAGARMEIEGFFDDVRRLIEVDLAVGSMLYRDEQVLAFSFPGQRFDDEKEDKGRSLNDKSVKELCGWIEQQIDKLAEKRNFETPPLCKLSTSTRSLIRMASEAADARRDLAIPIHRSWTIPNTNEQQQGHVCPVCQVRFSRPAGSGEANPKQRFCQVCHTRRRGRLDTWLREGTDTIWITELADDNDRVALLTFSFDLKPWLDGSRVDSLRAQSVEEWRRFNPTLRDQDNPIDFGRPTESLVDHISSFVESPRTVTSGSRAGKLDDAVLASINEGFAHEDDFGVFYSKIVEDRADDAPAWDEAKKDPALASRWLVHQLFRKNASPGRIHRFWRTAETFFDELIPVFREAAATHPNRWRTRRLILTPAGDRGTWEDRETYATRWNDAPLELLYRKETNDFLTICNLARVLRAEDEARVLQSKPLNLEGTDNNKTGSLDVQEIKFPAGLGKYSPLIVLDRSPARFRVLVPLSAAAACIDAAVGKWNEEFGRVWDRMPLRVGVIAFPRSTPFQAVIEAARSVEYDLAQEKPETWRVVELRSRDGVCALMMARPDGGHELVTMPVATPDGRPDIFYPYAAMSEPRVRARRDFVAPCASTNGGQVYRHVIDLAAGDGIRIVPSRYAVVFLDGTARRFEPMEVRYLSDWPRLRQTWDLLCRTAPSKTSLRRVWTTLADARERWRTGEDASSETFAEWVFLVRAVLASELGAKPPALDSLVEAAASGLLESTLDWHLRILKLDLEERI